MSAALEPAGRQLTLATARDPECPDCSPTGACFACFLAACRGGFAWCEGAGDGRTCTACATARRWSG